MISHSYTVDSLSQSQDLASKILSSSTPQQIISACASIESFVHSHSSDHSRHFFSITFPALILKLFGFANDSSSSSATSPPQSNGWIDVISSSNDPDLAARVFHLLSPNGAVFNSIYAVDRKSLVKFVFPTERLPEWARYMLSTEKYVKILSNLCPIFNGKLKEESIKGSASMYHIQLNVFEYYMFWFAYYPISRGNNKNIVSTVLMKRTKKEKFRLESWTNSIPGFTSNVKRGASQKIDCNLYLRLLCAYLLEFVPVSDLDEHQQPYRSSLLNYTGGYDGSVIMRAEFLVNTLVIYWLIDNDFSPLSVNMCKWYGVSYPIHSLLGDTPPTGGLGKVVKLLVKYLNLSSIAVSNGCESKVECSGSPKWRSPDSCSVLFDSGVKTRDLVSVMSCATAGCSWNAWVQRPLYRYILRTFLFCSIGTSIKNASDVFSVWVCYMEPWNITLDDFAELDEVVNGSSKNVRKDDSRLQACGYSSAWQGYVLSNYLYYSSLVMHFIGFAHKFLHTDPEVIVQMLLKVMNVSTSSKELIDLVKNVDTVFHSKQAGSSKSKLNSLYRFVPSIHEQLKDWEDGLCESDADGSFLHENWNKDLLLFSDGEDGGQQLLQLFILRAEAELQAISGGNLAQNLQCIDSLKSLVSCFSGGHAIKPIPFSLEVEQQQRQQSRDEIFRPKGAGNHASADIKYKGDWMKRPISDDEVACLAKFLIWLSDQLNESLRLNQPESGIVGPKWLYVEVSDENEGKVYGPTETMKTFLYAARSWLLVSMRKHGVRVNLRMLASKRIVAVLLLFAAFSILKKAFRPFLRA